MPTSSPLPWRLGAEGRNFRHGRGGGVKRLSGERAFRERHALEQQEVIDGQWGDSHPGLDTVEGREMEDPRR